MKLKKVVLPVAGLGARLLPVTKEQPKEMLPIFTSDKNNNKLVVPIIQLIFEQLYSMGFRDFCFIVGKNKRIIEDHFSTKETQNSSKNRSSQENMNSFFKKIDNSNIVWINQSQPLGFGHAVLSARPFVQDDPFLLHAGDTLLWSKLNDHVKNLINCHEQTSSIASFIVQQISDPRQYGVVNGKITKNIISVSNLEEKPRKPKTNLAIMPVYIFEPIIFDYIKKIKIKKNSEIQLTEAISKMVSDNQIVSAIDLTKNTIQMDIGNPESYWNSLKISYKLSKTFV